MEAKVWKSNQPNGSAQE